MSNTRVATGNEDQPLILTLRIDAASQAFYNDLRRKYFPAERNHIAAHLTLFHQLPDQERTLQALGECAAATVSFQLEPGTLRSIGKGVAVFFLSEPLRGRHADLAALFDSHLIAQDRQRFSPHIVIQNKVAPEAARHTLSQIDTGPLLAPQGIGLSVWRYLGGPWEHLLDLPFSSAHR